jgi:predicted HTH transcriptional regulator
MYENPEDLIRRIQLGEDSTLELKEIRWKGKRIAGPGRNELADEICAFANSRGGTILLGVDDKTKDITGIPLELLDIVENFIIEIAQDSIHPPVLINTVKRELILNTGDHKIILQVEVPRSLFVHKSPGGYFHRHGSSKREMSPDLLARLFQQRSQARIIRFDEQVVPGMTPDDLDPSLWQRFLHKAVQEPSEILLKRNILVRDDTGAIRPSVAGTLLCSRMPHQFLTGAYIEAVCYRGIHRDANEQIDARKITGPLDVQIDDAIHFLRRNNQVMAKKIPYRIDYPTFSEIAVFEAIVNAVAHRDYSIYGSKIRFFIFDDRLEIYSPGSLPNTISIDTLPYRQITRNELITSLLSEIPVKGFSSSIPRSHYMEKRGEGIPLIISECLNLSGREPEFRLLDDSEFMITMFAGKKPDSDPSGGGTG